MARLATKPCPICERPSVEKYRPFCSKRCADIDLSRWLKGSYAVPATEEPEDWTEDTRPPEGGPED